MISWICCAFNKHLVSPRMPSSESHVFSFCNRYSIPPNNSGIAQDLKAEAKSGKKREPFYRKENSIEYWSGYETGRSELFMELVKVKEEQEAYQREYESVLQLFNSYILKAQLQLQLIKGEHICDVALLRNEIHDLKSSLCVLRDMVDELVVLEREIVNQLYLTESSSFQQSYSHIRFSTFVLYMAFIILGRMPHCLLLCN